MKYKIRDAQPKIDIKELKDLIRGFERVENITDVIIFGDDGGIRRITFEE